MYVCMYILSTLLRKTMKCVMQCVLAGRTQLRNPQRMPRCQPQQSTNKPVHTYTFSDGIHIIHSYIHTYTHESISTLYIPCTVTRYISMYIHINLHTYIHTEHIQNTLSTYIHTYINRNLVILFGSNDADFSRTAQSNLHNPVRDYILYRKYVHTYICIHMYVCMNESIYAYVFSLYCVPVFSGPLLECSYY